jgi:predicted TIM-barrel fold metal-dependent hydrolase
MIDDMKIIDFRCRPPLAEYKTLFDVKFNRLSWENRFNVAPNNGVSPSMYHVGEDLGLIYLKQEMDAAGIDMIVAPGRRTPPDIEIPAIGEGQISINVTDEMLASLSKRFDGRLIGLTALDLAQPMDQLVAQIETAVSEYGLRGVVIEPGYYKAADGGTLWADDPSLYPIYETIIAQGIFLMHQSGIYAGPDFGVNHWPPLDRLLQVFPKLTILLAHGGYPAILESLALASKYPNFYLSPDIYCFFPGGELYVNAISKMPDQFVWASAYPLGSMKESVDGVLQFPLSDDVMHSYLYGNAARLLRLE